MAEDKITIYGELKSGVPGGYVTTADQVKGLDAISPMTDTTYEKLVELCDAGNLVPGMKYRFEYIAAVKASGGVQSYNIVSAMSSNQVSFITVTAINTYTLSDYALMITKNGYVYDVKYSLYARNYRWADDVHDAFSGVIYWMRDRNGNEAPYDFINIYFIERDVVYFTFSVTFNVNKEGSEKTNLFRNNVIGEYKDNSYYYIPFNIFNILDTTSEISNNTIKKAYDIHLGPGCCNNFFGESCRLISLGIFCVNNTFESNNREISLGPYCKYNIWKRNSSTKITNHNYQPIGYLEFNVMEESSSGTICLYESNPSGRNIIVGRYVSGNLIIDPEIAGSSVEKYFAYNSAGNINMYVGYRGMPENTNPVKSILSANGKDASWESMSSMVRSYKNVEFFDGFVNALDTYSEASLVFPVSGVYFLEDKGIFGGLRDGVYYNNWNDIRYPAADFNSYEYGISPRADRIFEDISTGKRYVWNSVNSSLKEYTES